MCRMRALAFLPAERRRALCLSTLRGTAGVGQVMITHSFDPDSGAIIFSGRTHGSKYILEVSCGPLSDEGFKSVAMIVMCSIQAAE